MTDPQQGFGTPQQRRHGARQARRIDDDDPGGGQREIPSRGPGPQALAAYGSW
jgi:hypothetical protein